MIDRQTRGIVPDKPHTAMRAPDGRLLYEEMNTRDGFDGGFTYFYHANPAPAPSRVRPSERGFASPKADDRTTNLLERRLYDSAKVPNGSMLCYERTPIFFNDKASVWFARPAATDEVYFANADGDELWFLHEGRARLESGCGFLAVSAGDYVFVPRALPHRWHVTSGPLRLLGIEGREGFKIPDAYRSAIGQLRMDAPYTHRDFVRPEGPIAKLGAPLEGPASLLVKRGGVFSLLEASAPLLDIVGWDGFVYPFAFPIEKFQPKTGARHLPPTVHSTFVGSGLAIGSFVP